MKINIENYNDETQSQKWEIDEHRLISYHNCKYYILICILLFVFCSLFIQIDLINVNQHDHNNKFNRQSIKHASSIVYMQEEDKSILKQNYGLKLRKLQMEEQNNAQDNLSQNNNTSYSKLQEDPHVQSPEANHTKIYVILLIVGLCLLLLGGIVILGVVVYRHFINPQQAPYFNRSNQIANGSRMQLDINMIAPPISYNIFLKQIGQPLHDNCVICLEQFRNQTPVNNIDNLIQTQQQGSNTNQNKQDDNKNLVSLTICGHLLHFKCLKQWISRQANCPLCRQQFSDQNLTLWQNKIGIDFSYLYQIFQKQIKNNKKYNNTTITANTNNNNKYRNSNKIVNINTIIRHQNNRNQYRYNNNRQNTNYNNTNTNNYNYNTRDSLQLHWLRIYNNRKIVNRVRHDKYNIYSIMKKINKNNNNNGYSGYNNKKMTNNMKMLTKITNQHGMQNSDKNNYDGSGREQSRCSVINKNITNMNNLWEEPTAKDMYPLMVYSAIMDYHQARNNQNNADNNQIIQQNKNNKISNHNRTSKNTMQQIAKSTNYVLQKINEQQTLNQPQDKQNRQHIDKKQDKINNSKCQMEMIDQQISSHQIQPKTNRDTKLIKQQSYKSANTLKTDNKQNTNNQLQVKGQNSKKASRVLTPFTQQLDNLQSLIYPPSVQDVQAQVFMGSLY